MKEPRQAPRIRLGCRLFFSGENYHEGEGVIVDLSKSGCAAESETAVTVGMVLELTIFLPDYDWQLHLDRSIVRWIQGQTFGLEFQDLRPVHRERLRRLVATFKASQKA
ncbi:MAG: PilZ domain-containing protein [Nitrospira sp.]|nr:PilZ domain-containing protein [Nitrospira sp.]